MNVTTPLEGQRVSYVGDTDNGLSVGDRGKVVSSDGNASHVLWMTGAKAGEIVLHDHFDLVVSSNLPTDNFDSGLVSFSVRQTFERYGSVGLLNALNEEGHLATFTDIAEDAVTMVASRIRQDPSFQEVLGHLEPEEGDDVVVLAASVLLRDAFGFGEEED